MAEKRKTGQLQIRVDPVEKRELQRRAKAAGMSLSSFILGRALPPKAEAFQRLVAELSQAAEASFVLAKLNDFLTKLSANELSSVLEAPPRVRSSPLLRTYVAAMVEFAAAQKQTPVPEWALNTPALERPYFASELKALRLHLLSAAPAAFRRRNLFVDASVGARV